MPGAEAPPTLQDTLVGKELPKAGIRIDGNFEDWSGILPVFSHKGTARKGNLAIDKIFLAVDEKNLYMRFDVKDATPSSLFHPHNFDAYHNSSYGVDLQNGMKHLVAQITYDVQAGRYFVEVVKLANRSSQSIDKTYGNFAMKGSSVEVSFPLETIKKSLGMPAVGGYIVTGRDGYTDKAWIDGDRTTPRVLIF